MHTFAAMMFGLDLGLLAALITSTWRASSGPWRCRLGFHRWEWAGITAPGLRCRDCGDWWE